MLDKQLRELIEPAIEALGFELWGLERFSQGSQPALRVYVDSVTGVTVDDCATVSRQIDAVLRVESEHLPEQYILEVSSPGLNRSLFLLSHYQRFLGSKVHIRLRKGAEQENRRNYTGILSAADEEHVTLYLDEGVEQTLPFSSIEKAKLVNGDYSAAG